MALLGTYWDVYRNRTLAAGADLLILTYAHSLGTTPDLVLPVLRSIQRLSGAGALVAEGGNASLATVGVVPQSFLVASVPLVDFDLFVVYCFSAIR